MNRTYTKKAWEFSQSLVPRIEALALPDTVERATRKPTPNMNVAPIRRRTDARRQKGCEHNTFRRASTVAMFLTVSETCEISMRQVQSAVNALFIYVLSPPVHLSGLPQGVQRHKDSEFSVYCKIIWIKAIKLHCIMLHSP